MYNLKRHPHIISRHTREVLYRISREGRERQAQRWRQREPGPGGPTGRASFPEVVTKSPGCVWNTTKQGGAEKTNDSAIMSCMFGGCHCLKLERRNLQFLLSGNTRRNGHTDAHWDTNSFGAMGLAAARRARQTTNHHKGPAKDNRKKKGGKPYSHGPDIYGIPYRGVVKSKTTAGSRTIEPWEYIV